MTAKQRVRPIITLSSPQGKTFNAKWIGDKRTVKKKVAMFDFPYIKGTVVQDLFSSSREYPLMIMFDGQDHDNDAQDFFDEIDNESGTWEINHPKKGFMVLQPLSITESVEPVRSANHTEFETVWMEPIDPETLLTGAELAALQGEELNEFNELVGEQFAATIDETDLQSIADETKNLLEKIKAATSKMLAGVTAIQEKLNNTQLFLEDMLDTLILDPLLIAASIQQLVQTPALIAGSLKSRFEYYGDLVDQIFDREADESQTPASKNQVAVQELGAASTMGALSIIGFTANTPVSTAPASPAATGPTLITATQQEKTATSTLKTKASLSAAIDDYNNQNEKIINGMDANQELYQDEPLQDQYFSNSQAAVKANTLMALTNKFLQQNFYTALLEKRFILAYPQTPMQITIEKYGSLGEEDSNLDLFLESNNIKNDDVYILERGREVVIYA